MSYLIQQSAANGRIEGHIRTINNTNKAAEMIESWKYKQMNMHYEITENLDCNADQYKWKHLKINLSCSSD